MSTAKFDAIDLIVSVLKEHEKNFDELIEKLEKIVEKNESPWLSFEQARKIVMSQSTIIHNTIKAEDERNKAMEDFVNALNENELIPHSFKNSLLKIGKA